MTPETFLEWHLRLDEGLFELVDGEAVPHAKMRCDVSAEHDRTKVNLIGMLGQQLRGRVLRVATGRVPVRTGPASMRRPDLAVVTDPVGLDVYETRDPRLVIEIMSPSTNDIERFRRLDEYRLLPGLSYILLVDTRSPQILVYEHCEHSWKATLLEGLGATITLPRVGVQLALSDVYEGIRFDMRPVVPAFA